MNFEAFTHDILLNGWNVYGVEVYRDGGLEHAFGDVSNRHAIYSATKTVTSIAAGMAMDEGRLDIEKPLTCYLPANVLSHLPQRQRTVYNSLPLRRLMCMSVEGYPFRAAGESWLMDALSYPLPELETPRFRYSNIPAYLTGVAVSCAVEEDLYTYLQRKLFTPLGIMDPLAARCPDGFFYGASGMELTVNELSRIGLMLMQGGMWQGQRIVSNDYVMKASSVHQMNREGGYGYFLWKYRDGFSINGKWGQKCYVLPNQKLVITFLSHIEEPCPGLRESMELHLLEE